TRALRLADHRMYREKAISRTGGVELITAVLQAALAQRQSELAEHSNDVAGDVQMLARRIGLDDEAIGQIVKAGDLHDIGKLGIPDEILIKPGPLSAEEWEFMKRHTSMGEQIIAAGGRALELAPATRPLAGGRRSARSRHALANAPAQPAQGPVCALELRPLTTGPLVQCANSDGRGRCLWPGRRLCPHQQGPERVVTASFVGASAKAPLALADASPRRLAKGVPPGNRLRCLRLLAGDVAA